MSASSPPIAPGSKGLAAYDSVYEVNLGKKWTVDGNDWRLCKTGGALTSCGSFALVTAVSSGLPTYVVNTTTTASEQLIVGVLHEDQVDLASGDYCMVQCSGYCNTISAAAIASDAAIGTSTTAGKVDDATITVGGTLGYALESAAGADELVATRLLSL